MKDMLDASLAAILIVSLEAPGGNSPSWSSQPPRTRTLSTFL